MDRYKSFPLDSTSETSPKPKHHIIRDAADMSDSSNKFDTLSKEHKAVQMKRTMAILMEWPNWDIWPFKIALPVIGLAATIPGFVLNTAFRKSLLLGHYGKASSYLATCGIPAGASAMIHHMSIQTDIFEQKTKCPVCLQVRGACLQLAVGFLYPMLLAPLVSFPIASGMKNLYFPKFHKQPREVLTFARDVILSVKNRYLAIGALQVIVGMGMTYFEQRCYMYTLYPVLIGEKVVNKDKITTTEKD